MSKPPYSPNAGYILQNAQLEARRRHHILIGTEHLVLAIVNSKFVRALSWIAATTYPGIDIDEGVSRIQDDIRSYLQGRKWFNLATTNEGDISSEHVVEPTFCVLSSGLRNILAIRQFLTEIQCTLAV